MKKLMAKKGMASGIIGVIGQLMAKKRADTAARAATNTPMHNAQATNTPMHNAQASASVVPPSEEERKRRRSGTVLNPTDKLG